MRVRVVRVLVVLVVVGSVLAPSSGVGSDRVLAQTEESAGGLCDVGGVEQFSDVGVGVYGAEYVLCMRALGLSVGRGDGGFGPGLELTRGQMASFLVRLWRDVLGRECPDDVGVPFEDVAGSVHEANIVCLFGLEVTKGTTSVTYGPSEKLKASQIARFLLRTFEKTGGSCDGPRDELERALECLLRLGVIPSKAEAAGSGPVTRAQMAVYVIGLWHNIAGDGAAPTPPGKPSGGRDEDDDGRVTVPVRAERVELAHISEGHVRVALGLEEPVSVGGALSGTADATGLAVAVDGEGRPQGLSLVVKGDTAVDVHVDYKTTAAALVLLTPGLATMDPMITLGLVVLLAELAELEALANQLEVDAARYGPDYLVDLSSQAQQALSAAVVALVAAVEDLAAGGLAVDLSGFGPPGGTVGGRVVAGLGLVADDELSPAGQAGWGGSVAIPNECEPAWNEEDGTFGVWDPSPTLIGGDDRICLEGPISSLSGENDSWWSALLVPVTVMDGGVVRFFEDGEMYISSKTADFPDIFGEVIWGAAKEFLCGQVSSWLGAVEWVSFGRFKNPLRCGTWSSYVEVFRLNSGGIVENADLRPLYDSDDPVKRLAVVKSNMAGPNRYETLPVDNPERLSTLQRTGTIYQAVHLLTPVLGIALDAAMGKVTKELKPILGDFLETSGKRFVTANTDQVADFSATLARIVAATLVNTTDDKQIEDLTQHGNRYSPEEKEHSLRQITSILLPIVEVVLLGPVKKVAAAAIPVVGQVITAIEVLDTGIGVVNTAGTWTQAILQHGYPTLNFYAQGKPLPDKTFALVLDASGSMADFVPEGRKIDIAVDAITATYQTITEELGQQAEVLVYSSKGGFFGCTVPSIESASKEWVRSWVPVPTVVPGGSTPTGRALQAAMLNLGYIDEKGQPTGGGSGEIILVSDGESNCPPDPCQVVRDTRIPVVVHTVGFLLAKDDTAAEQELRCIAQVTGGISVTVEKAGDTIAAIRPIVREQNIVHHIKNVPAGFTERYSWWRFTDRDNDGIPDKWEENGVFRSIWAGGRPIGEEWLDLPAAGADPDRKDLFIYYDWEEGAKFDEEVLDIVWSAFADAPFDAGNGIWLHFIEGTEIPSKEIPSFSGSNDEATRTAELTAMFEATAEYSGFDQSMWAGQSQRAGLPQLAKYLLIRRPCDPTCPVGQAYSSPGNFGVIFMGGEEWCQSVIDRVGYCWLDTDEPPPGIALAHTYYQAGTVMHILGHLLGLHDHGKESCPRVDPSYRSVMSHAYTAVGIEQSDGAFLLDYARDTTVNLDWKSGTFGRGIAEDHSCLGAPRKSRDNDGSITLVLNQYAENPDFYLHEVGQLRFGTHPAPQETSLVDLIDSVPDEYLESFAEYFGLRQVPETFRNT